MEREEQEKGRKIGREEGKEGTQNQGQQEHKSLFQDVH